MRLHLYGFPMVSRVIVTARCDCYCNVEFFVITNSFACAIVVRT